MTESHSTDASEVDEPGPDRLQERLAALNEKAGDLADTLERIDNRLSEALGRNQAKSSEEQES